MKIAIISGNDERQQQSIFALETTEKRKTRPSTDLFKTHLKLTVDFLPDNSEIHYVNKYVNAVAARQILANTDAVILLFATTNQECISVIENATGISRRKFYVHDFEKTFDLRSTINNIIKEKNSSKCLMFVNTWEKVKSCLESSSDVIIKPFKSEKNAERELEQQTPLTKIESALPVENQQANAHRQTMEDEFARTGGLEDDFYMVPKFEPGSLPRLRPYVEEDISFPQTFKR